MTQSDIKGLGIKKEEIVEEEDKRYKQVMRMVAGIAEVKVGIEIKKGGEKVNTAITIKVNGASVRVM